MPAKGWTRDLTGQRFGRLVAICSAEPVIYKNDKYKDGYAKYSRWKCLCDCGNECIVRTEQLTGNHTQSCGCLQKEKTAEIRHNKKFFNRYEEKDGYVVGFTSKDEPFYIDKEDYIKVKEYLWYKTPKGYIVSSDFIKDGKRKTIRLHRFVTDFKYPLVDHKNRKKYDNRKENLRQATHSENTCNAKDFKNNSSGVKGVNWRKRDKVWSAFVVIDKKQLWLGQYKNKEEAIKARLEAEAKYYGEFAPQRHLFEQYGIEVD